jgi:predicted DNA-binding transcriptional regulator AlpA
VSSNAGAAEGHAAREPATPQATSRPMRHRPSLYCDMANADQRRTVLVGDVHARPKQSASRDACTRGPRVSPHPEEVSVRQPGACRSDSGQVASPLRPHWPDSARTSEVATPTDEPPVVAPTQLMSDKLIGIQDIRELFQLGRTAAYELTRRPDFPNPVVVSPRCYRWWATEVAAFAASLRREPANPRRPTTCATERHVPRSTTPRCITGRVRAARPRRAS